LNKSPKETLDKLFEFLALKPYEVTPLIVKNKAAGVKNKGLNNFLVDRDNWLRRLIRKPLQIGFVRSLIFKTGIVEKIKDVNRVEQVYREMTQEEKDFCETYFENDLAMLKKDFGIVW